jgi:hypothetical protein
LTFPSSTTVGKPAEKGNPMALDRGPGWVMIEDLTPDVIRNMERAQRMRAAHEGCIDQYEREYRQRAARHPLSNGTN